MNAETGTRGRSGRAVRCALMLTTALTAAGLQGDAAAQERVPEVAQAQQHSFDIPAQSLTDALALFGRQSGMQVSVDAGLIRDIASPGVRGTMSSEQALGRLLAGTGITYRITGGNTAMLQRPQSGMAETGVLQLDPVRVEGEGIALRQAEIGNLPPEYSGGQVARGGKLGLLGNRDFMDTPFNQTSYTQKTIQDQQARTLGDVLENDPSVRSNFPSSAGVEGFNIRGFSISNSDVAFGGLYGIAPTFGGAMETFAIERVEVLKGPSALLNGIAPGNSIGGTVNLVPKRAGKTPFVQVTPSYTSDLQLGGHVDMGRRFGPDDSVGVRVNALYRNGDTAIDRESQETRAAALGLDFQVKSFRASADLGYQYQDTEAQRRFVFLAAGVPVPEEPDASSNWSQPWTFLENENGYGMVRGELDIAENVTAFVAAGGGLRQVRTIRQNPQVLDTQGTITGTALKANGYDDFATVEAGMRGSLATGFIRHDLSVAQTVYWRDTGSASSVVAVAASNLYSPVFAPEPNFAVLPDPEDTPKISEQMTSSLAFADTLSVLDERVQLTAGVRRQRVRAENFNATTGVRTSGYENSALTPAFGLVVKPFNYLSLYANYIEGLQQGQTAPLTAVNSGEVFPPFATEQYEAGIKVDFGNLATTLSVFQVSQPSAFLDPATNIFAVDGEQRHRGLELAAFGTVMEGVRILGGVTFIDAELTKTQGGVNEGNTAPGVPWAQANLGAEWDTPFLRALTLSARALYTSSAEYDQANTREFPAWTRFDLGARYAIATRGVPIVVRANVLNLLDSDDWATADNFGSLGLGAPRTFLLSTSFTF